MKVDHKSIMFQIIIKILVCLYVLIFYSNKVFSKTNKNIINKTNFQIQAIIVSNIGSGLGLSYKLNNDLWFSLEQQTLKGTMSRNTNDNSNREDSDFYIRAVYANLKYYLTDILDKLSF